MPETKDVWGAIKSLQEQVSMLADNQKTILEITSKLEKRIKRAEEGSET